MALTKSPGFCFLTVVAAVLFILIFWLHCCGTVGGHPLRASILWDRWYMCVQCVFSLLSSRSEGSQLIKWADWVCGWMGDNAIFRYVIAEKLQNTQSQDLAC